MIEDGGMHLAFERNASDSIFDPGDGSKRRVDPANLHHDPVTNLSKTLRAADLAPALGDIDEVDIDKARFHPALDEQTERAALR